MMHKRIVLGLLAGSLSLSTFPMSEKPVAPTAEQAPVVKHQFAVKTIDYVTNKLTHIKKCLQGKETCSQSDFFVLIGTLLFLRSFLYELVRHTEIKRSGPAIRPWLWRIHEDAPGYLTDIWKRLDPSFWGLKSGAWVGKKVGSETRKLTDPIEKALGGY